MPYRSDFLLLDYSYIIILILKEPTFDLLLVITPHIISIQQLTIFTLDCFLFTTDSTGTSYKFLKIFIPGLPPA